MAKITDPDELFLNTIPTKVMPLSEIPKGATVADAYLFVGYGKEFPKDFTPSEKFEAYDLLVWGDTKDFTPSEKFEAYDLLVWGDTKEKPTQKVVDFVKSLKAAVA